MANGTRDRKPTAAEVEEAEEKKLKALRARQRAARRRAND